MASPIRPPAPRPCDTCPYRQDVPAGIWAAEEYEKLRRYDAPTGEQPGAVFQCHQADRGSDAARLCAGWAGCHGYDLLALRMAVRSGRIDVETFRAAAEYVSPVPLFATGREAAEHGESGTEFPDRAAQQAIDKITRKRGDLEIG